MMKITAHQARPRDIVLDPDGVAWQKDGPGVFEWSTFAGGPVMHYGPWVDSYGPQGELDLIARDGKPAER